MLKRTDSVHGYPFIFSGPEAAINDTPKTVTEACARRLIRNLREVLELSITDDYCNLPICAAHAHAYRNTPCPEALRVEPIAPLPLPREEASQPDYCF